MNLRNQKRMSAQVMKVGINKIKFNPERLEEVSEALTREDIRYLVSSGAIAKEYPKGNSRARIKARKGKRSGEGKRKGTRKARMGGKSLWINKIRALRDELRKLKEEGKITPGQYRKLYLQSKGNLFNSRRHMREYVERTLK